MAKNKNDRTNSENTKNSANDSANTNTANSGLDLLELGPDDGQELLEFEGGALQKATIKVIGVGGGGGNALNTMIESGLSGVEFVAANTDAQALAHNKASIKVQLGAEITRGLGCGANPDRGRASALEARDRLREILEGSDMVFVTAGMGGGTGTGAAPIVAEVAREVGALTVGVVTKPFPFEGRVRMKHAGHGLDELHSVVDTLITIPNQRLLALAGKGTAVRDAFSIADQVLLNAVRGISDLITIHGLINLDFADVRTVMNEAGVALMGTGIGNGETRAIDAASAAISSPLLEDLSIEGARGVLINITGGSEMTLFEVNEASSLVHEAAHEDANIIVGAVIDEALAEDELRVTVIATGLDGQEARRTPPISQEQPQPTPPDQGRRVTDHTDHEIQQEIEMVDAPNVTPIRQEPAVPAAAPAMSGAASGAAGGFETTGQFAQPEPQQQMGFQEEAQPATNEMQSAAQMAETGLEFESPFEDELDTPAFLRKSRTAVSEDDTDVPAFMRRGGSSE
ncbi:MAG: cell division protein FtsZ [Myxococcota bacterium]